MKALGMVLNITVYGEQKNNPQKAQNRGRECGGLNQCFKSASL
jgi:hypothetical protein